MLLLLLLQNRSRRWYPQADPDCRKHEPLEHDDQQVRAGPHQGHQGPGSNQHEGERGGSGNVHQAADEDEDDDDDRQRRVGADDVDVDGAVDNWKQRTSEAMNSRNLTFSWPHT